MANIVMVGCGDLGSGLGLQLSALGHTCYGLRRQCNQLPAAIQGIAADITDAASLSHLPANIDYLVYSLTPAAFDAESYQRAYVTGLQNIISALHHQGQQPRRLLFVSSTAVYPQNQGEWVDETSPCQPKSFSGQAMLAAERVLQACPFATTSIRFSGIYGPGRDRLINWALEGVVCDPAHPHYSNRIHRDDCVGILQYLIEQDMAGNAVADIYVGSDPNPTSYDQILDWIRAELNVQLGADCEPIDKKLRAGSKRCKPQRLLDSGYTFLFPDFKAGFAPALDRFRD